MAGTGFLRTVNFGGFDKKDVLAYVDELNTKIYNLETVISEKDKMLEGAPAFSGDSEGSYVEGKEKYEAIIAESNARISELMANVDTLNLQVSTLESELEQANSDVNKLNEEKKMLEEKVQSVQSGQPAAETTFDIGSVFIEAKHSADRIVAEAKNAAKKMDDDSRKLSQQIIDEANARAEKIIVDAQSQSVEIIYKARTESETVVRNANTKADDILRETNSKKEMVVSQFNYITTDIEKLATCLNDIVSDGVLKLVDAKKIIEEANVVVKEFSGDTDDSANGYNISDDSAEAQKKNTNVTNVEELLSKLDDEEIDNTYFNSENFYNQENEGNEETLFFVGEETGDANPDQKSPSPSFNMNLDLDLLAGLTAEIEADSGNERDYPDDIMENWDNKGEKVKKISLVDDYE